MRVVPYRLRPLSEQVKAYAGHLADLEHARTPGQAGAVWSRADLDRDIGHITDLQHAIIAGRAEELIATLPGVLVPAQRTPGGDS